MDHRVDRSRCPQELALQGAAIQLQVHGLKEVALGDGANDPRHARQVLGVSLIELDDAVDFGRDLGVGSVRCQRHPDREVALFQLPQNRQNQLGIVGGDAIGFSPVRAVRAGSVGARCGGLAPAGWELRAPWLVGLGHSLLYTKQLCESQTNRGTAGDQDGPTLPIT